jgi:glycosyltransferase involved in cell wall biosynthesis
MKLWLDVDDLFYFAERSARPTGIQRLTGEVYTALNSIAGDAVGFVRHDGEGGFAIVSWAEVAHTYEKLVGESAPPATTVHETMTCEDRPSWLKRLALALGLRSATPPSRELRTAALPPTLKQFARPGDMLCALGAPWHDPLYKERVERCKTETGVRFSVLIHDLIPLIRPEFFEKGRAPHFEAVIGGILPLTDQVLTNSRATAADVTRWSSERGIVLKAAPEPLPIGTGFSSRRSADHVGVGTLPSSLKEGDFVLFVSTIEVRKNHTQAFRIWCQLLRELPQALVPTLVFAGSWGWMVEDLRKAIEATNHLNGKLQIILSPDDATLAALYKGCRFSLYLSYYEGWGLPVSDSLSYGKPCVASNRASIPEAGGRFCVYVDPDNTTEAAGVVRSLLTDPSRLECLEADLKAGFMPTSWTETARSLLDLVSPRLYRPVTNFRADDRANRTYAND